MSGDTGPVLALSGGVGGAKLALGLYRILPPDTLTVVANTGDDFEHLGLSISPDLDTLLYTLSGQDNPELGWGRRGETWTFMAALEALGGETWFRLGDGDLATHVERTRRLKAGESLSAIIDDFRRRLGIAARHAADVGRPGPHPRCGHRTEGWLDFQDYFVRAALRTGDFASWPLPAPTGAAAPGVSRGAGRPDELRAVVICPSNPFISIDPILAVPGVRAALARVPRAGGRGVADRRRPGGQGPDRQDDGRARPAGRCRGRRRGITAISSTSTSPTRRMPLRSPGSTCRSC